MSAGKRRCSEKEPGRDRSPGQGRPSGDCREPLIILFMWTLTLHLKAIMSALLLLPIPPYCPGAGFRTAQSDLPATFLYLHDLLNHHGPHADADRPRLNPCPAAAREDNDGYRRFYPRRRQGSARHR